MADKTGKTKWHLLLGGLLERTLPPVGITVQMELPIMNKPPRADILLLRREKGDQWTPEQYGRLPDGIRDSNAKHILLEFKYTESVNKTVLQKTLGYYVFYRTVQQLKEREVAAFILSSRTPNKKFLHKFGYQAGEKSGVYYSRNTMLTHVAIIALNELQTVEHNTFVKFFASRQREREQAFYILEDDSIEAYSQDAQWYMYGLHKYWSAEQGEMKMVDIEVTPEQMVKMGKTWKDAFLNMLPAEEVLTHYTAEDRMAGLQPKERLAGLTQAEIEEMTNYLQQMRKANG